MINAGNMYLEGGQFESALNLFNESIDFAKEHGLEPFDMAYERIGRVYMEEGQFEEAEKVIRKATWINPLYLGQIMFKTGRYDIALKYFERCLTFGTSPESKVDRVAAYKGISEVQLIQGNKGFNAKCKTGLHPCRFIHLRNSREMLPRSLLNYEKAGDFGQSLRYFKLSKAIQDSISGGSLK
jgi:tetratricopeptide (TPR) repeat protein